MRIIIDMYSFFNDVIFEILIFRHEKINLVPHVYQIVGKVYSRCYHPVCLRVEDVEPKCYSHPEIFYFIKNI